MRHRQAELGGWHASEAGIYHAAETSGMRPRQAGDVAHSPLAGSGKIPNTCLQGFIRLLGGER